MEEITVGQSGFTNFAKESAEFKKALFCIILTTLMIRSIIKQIPQKHMI